MTARRGGVLWKVRSRFRIRSAWMKSAVRMGGRRVDLHRRGQEPVPHQSGEAAAPGRGPDPALLAPPLGGGPIGKELCRGRARTSGLELARVHRWARYYVDVARDVPRAGGAGGLTVFIRRPRLRMAAGSFSWVQRIRHERPSRKLENPERELQGLRRRPDHVRIGVTLDTQELLLNLAARRFERLLEFHRRFGSRC